MIIRLYYSTCHLRLTPNHHSFPTRRSSDLALRVFRVRADDVPHQPVAHDVRLREIAERDALDARQNALHLEQSRVLPRSEEHTSELQSHSELVCRLLREKKKSRYYGCMCKF